MSSDTPRFLAACHMTPPMGGDPVTLEAVWAAFSDREVEPGKSFCAAGEPVWSDPPDASGPIVNDIAGKIVFIIRGNADWITKSQHAEQAGAVGVIFINSEDALDPLPVAENGQQALIPCVMIKKNALNDTRLTRKSFGRGPVPDHINPDGPSFCTITSATMGNAGMVDFRSLVDGLTGQFTDPDFPANENSLYIDPSQPMPAFQNRQIIWKRPKDLSQQPQLFVDDVNEDGDGAEANDIIQGSLGDCFLLSAAAILASAKGHDLIKKLFAKTMYFDKGLLGIRLFKEGRWMDVVVDTCIPCLDGRAPCFVKMKDPDEFWMIFLEKAYAKIHGCYEALDGGFMNESLVDMTGAAPGRVKVLDLFAACTRNGKVETDRAMHLLASRSHGILLQGASSDAGGSEEALGGGLYSGHAYSINDCRKTSCGEVLVQLRNPWGGHEWTGAWHDKDPRWTDALKKELNHTDKDDGMFWMSISDFARSFTEITFCDILPDSFTILRAEGAWTNQTAGGCANHRSWCNNPQLLMTVTQTTHITISLNQPDTRMQSKQMGKAAFDQLYVYGAGYDDHIGFAVFKGGARKQRYSSKEIIADAQYTGVRTVSTTIAECSPGEYIIVPTTFDPKIMKFHMRFWANNPITLVDTMGGRDIEFFDASQDSLSKYAVPLSLGVGKLTPVEQAAPEAAAAQQTDIIKKYSRDDAAAMSGMLTGITDGLKKAIWKIGELIPKSWQHGCDFLMAAHNTFQVDEIAAIMRSDRSIRFAKISEVLNGGTYEVMVAHTAHGPLYKTGVPAQYLGKLEQQNGIPEALLDQLGQLFDMLDTDGSGYLEVQWDSNELATDVGKRLLMELGVENTNLQETYLAMKELDANGDGRVDRAEFVNWMASRAVKLA